jgi:hypothetical protein
MASRTRSRAALALATVASFGAAFLIFAVEPMFAKRLLPELGGSPAVWTALLMCYQLLLVAGYAYSHATSRLTPRRQAVLHAALLLGAIFTSRLGQEGSWATSGLAPLPWLLWTAALSLGPVFLILSGSAPTLQRLASLGSKNPYSLYVASNIGSLLALLAYPLFLERLLPLPLQMSTWRWGVAALAVLVVAGAWLMPRGTMHAAEDAGTGREGAPEPGSLGAGDALGGARAPRPARDEGAPTARQIGRWILLAMVPTSLSMSFTTYVTTDIASVPFLWTVPLAVYLLTFVLVFAEQQWIARRWLLKAFTPSVFLAALLVVLRAKIWLLLPLHMAVLFVVAMIAHGELAESRPSVRHLTRFYLWMSIGGAIGGLFNTLVTPLLFSAEVEYATILFLAAFALPAEHRGTLRGVGVRLAIAVAAGVALLVLTRLAPLLPGGSSGVELLVGAAIGGVLIQARESREKGIEGLLLTMAFATWAVSHVPGEVLAQGRNFFGAYSVKDRAGVRYFSHGTTLHGLQRLRPEDRTTPLAYYSAEGPMGQAVSLLLERPGPLHAALGGMGTGSALCHGPGRIQWSVVEIDPVVARLAGKDGLFTFLSECAPDARVQVGDARLVFEADTARYDLVIIDAFTSDAVPIHLLTREALGAYRDRLRPDGLLLFNISNRYMDLEPVLAAHAEALGLEAIAGVHAKPSEDPLVSPSVWVALGWDDALFQQLLENPIWRTARKRPGLRPWTDDYSSVIPLLNAGNPLRSAQD